MDLWSWLKLRLGAGDPWRAGPNEPSGAAHPARARADDAPHDQKRLLLVIGLGALSWVATYVGMLELIESNLGDLPILHKIIIGFSVAMLMTMIIWLLDKMFAPTDAFTKVCYIAGYLFLSVISVGFGFGFYWKVLESRGEASRSAESAITQVQSALFGASTRLEQLLSTLDQLTTISAEKAEIERATGKSCPNSGPGDGPRRKMREEDAGRFKFAADFVKGRITTVKSDIAALDTNLQKIVNDDRSVIDVRTGNRNEFLRGIGRKLDLTVTGFNAFRSDPQLRQIRTDLADRAEKTTITGPKGIAISCPDGQLQMALRGVVSAIDQLPELTKPQVAAVEGSEATIEAFRRLTTTFFGLITFRLPPSADELRELQRKAVQSIDGAGSSGVPAMVQAAGLAKRDYVPLAVAIFVDLCLLLVSIGRPVNQFLGLERSMREAEDGPVYPILARFHDIHADSDAVRHFEVFRDVIFDLNGHYHVAVPLNVPKHAENYAELEREAHRLANLCYALEGKGILTRPMSVLPGLLVQRQLKRRGSKFVQCYGRRRPARYRRGWDAIRSLWSETPVEEKPTFKVYRFKRGAWPEMILGAVMGASRSLSPLGAEAALSHASGAAGTMWRNGHAEARLAPPAAWSASARAIHNGRHEERDAGHRPRELEPELEFAGQERARAAYNQQPEGQGTAFSEHSRNETALSSVEPAQFGEREPRRAATTTDQASRLLGQLRRAWARLLPGNPDRSHELEGLGSQATSQAANLEPARIASRFAGPSNEART